MRPYDAKTYDDILKLRRDNYPAETDVWSMLLGGDHVTLFPPNGEGPYVTIPRDQFNTIVRWYLRDQEAPVRKPKAKKRKTA